MHEAGSIERRLSPHGNKDPRSKQRVLEDSGMCVGEDPDREGGVEANSIRHGHAGGGSSFQGGVNRPKNNQQKHSAQMEDEYKLMEMVEEDCKCAPRKPVPPPPTELPFPATEENAEKLENYLKEYYAESALNMCPHQELQVISGEPMTIQFKEGMEPKAAFTPAKVPLHYRDEVKKGLDDDEALGIIERVPEGTPTKWCSRMVTQVKKSGDVWICKM